jgi:hypothetical protein
MHLHHWARVMLRLGNVMKTIARPGSRSSRVSEEVCVDDSSRITSKRIAVSGTSFTSLKQLQEHIDAYVNAYNDKAEPFVWTKKKVRQRRFKGRRITQL